MKRPFTLSFLLLYTFVSLPLYSQDRGPRELFAAAYALYSQGNHADAEPLFVQTLNGQFPLEDYSLYFLGMIQLARSDWKNARSTFSQLKQRLPQSIWSAQADLQLAKISLEEKNYQQAATELRSIRAATPKKEISDHALYLLGQTYEGQSDLKQAYASYQELRQTSPLSSWAMRAKREVRRLREQQPELFAPATSDALAAEADLLLREQDYAEAEKIYRRLLESNPEGQQRAGLLMGLANVYRAQRKRDEGIAILTEIVTRYPQYSQTPNALNRLAQTYWNRDQNLKALEYFDLLKQRYPKSAFVDYAQFVSGRIYESLGRSDDALRLYREFPKKFAGSKWRKEASWREAWIRYLRAEYQTALALFKRIAEDPEAEGFKNTALYWEGRTAAKLGRPDDATQIFLQILNSKEDTYYKGPAARELASLGVAIDEKKKENAIATPEPKEPSPPNLSFHLIRAQELAQISLNQFAVHELDEVKNNGKGDSSLSRLLMGEYARLGAYGRSVALANQLSPSSEELDRYRYPLAYWDGIQKTAKDTGLDPYLVLGIIRQESLFDPKVVSPASAYGLMQLLPSTAGRTAAQLGLPPPPREKLFEPDLNLTLGMYHFKELLQLYSNNPIKAIAAYNAGQDAVARWEKQIITDDPEEFIERIPYSETRLYVKLVLRNHLNYQQLYGNAR